ncbi:MAG: YkgJ family cysteine cluster protein [Myxococcota bacterium]|jgi:hypothetical protein|nr:YkgJ family cysteine cluster protein [Myxococcota bacterium]
MSASQSPWYRDGLRFECTRCGRCCRGAGNVWLSEDEIHALAEHLGEDEAAFRERATRRAGRLGVVLREKRNRDCLFHDPKVGCTVYPVRPRQCDAYPFWRANLVDRETWAKEALSCPGLGDGPLYSRETVEATAANDGLPDKRTRQRDPSGE